MKKCFLSFLMIGSTLFATSQLMRNTGQLSGGVYSGSSIETFDLRSTKKPEENFLEEEWMLGSIYFINEQFKPVERIPMRYNVVLDELEVDFENKIRVVNLSRVSKFNWSAIGGSDLLSRQFKNVSQIESLPYTIAEVIYIGDKYSAYIAYDHVILSPNYNPQFDTGSKEPQTVIKEKYYIVDEKTEASYEIKLRKSNFLKTFKKLDPKVYQHLKKSDINLSNTNSFAASMKEANELISKN